MLVLGGCKNPISHAWHATTHAASSAAGFVWDHQGTIATVVAGGACIAVTVGTCAARAGGAFLLRAQQRGRRHWRESVVDGVVTYSTFGVAAVGEAGLAGVGGFGKWGLKGALALPGFVGDWSDCLNWPFTINGVVGAGSRRSRAAIWRCSS